MFKDTPAFSGFSVKDLAEAEAFYSKVLGLSVKQDPMGLYITTTGNEPIFVYEKPDHAPATFTILNFVVKDIDAAVDELESKGVTFEKLDFGGGIKTDSKGIMRGKPTNDGPNIAWLKDPSGNTLSVLEN